MNYFFIGIVFLILITLILLYINKYREVRKTGIDIGWRGRREDPIPVVIEGEGNKKYAWQYLVNAIFFAILLIFFLILILTSLSRQGF